MQGRNVERKRPSYSRDAQNVEIRISWTTADIPEQNNHGMPTKQTEAMWCRRRRRLERPPTHPRNERATISSVYTTECCERAHVGILRKLGCVWRAPNRGLPHDTQNRDANEREASCGEKEVVCTSDCGVWLGGVSVWRWNRGVRWMLPMGE